MNFTRFQQIHQYFTLQDKSVYSHKKEETFAWSVKSITTTVKQNCSILWFLSSYLTINKVMISYCNRTKYKVKLLNKLIKKEYKIWILGDSNYVYNWLWHSYINESKEISKKNIKIERISSEEELIKILLISIFAFIIRLVQHLY